MDWRQGEHVSLIGHTGGGKTTLGLGLLDMRRDVVVIGTKGRDETLDTVVRSKRRGGDGYKRIAAWPPPILAERVCLWPRIGRASDVFALRPVYLDALDSIYEEGAWCVFIDEVLFLSQTLGLRRMFDVYWSQARSNRVSLVACTQRPYDAPLMMYSQATHLFLWSENDENNLKRIKEIGSRNLNSSQIKATLRSLGEYEALYLNTRTGASVITQAPERR